MTSGQSGNHLLYPYHPNYTNYLMHIRALHWLNASWDINSSGPLRYEKEIADMLKSSVIAVVLVTMLGLSASASASTAGWMVNGTQLTGTAAVATTGSVDEIIKMSGFGVELSCSGKNIQMLNPKITAPNAGSASSLTFTGCTALTTNCTLSSTSLSTLPLSMEVTLEGALGATGKVQPTTGTLIATFKFEGEKCGVAGTKAVTGNAVVSFSGGQSEHVLQPGAANTAASELSLKLGSAALKISGAALLQLASRLPWSFL